MRIAHSPPAAAHDELPAYPRDMNVAGVFEWYAARHPDRPAILEAQGCLTYGALDRIASQLARRIVALGVPAGSAIGTLTDRSAETIVAWLAILKSGCAYLPLDTARPTEALAFILEDAEAPLVLGESELLKEHGSLEKNPALANLILRSIEDELDLAEGENPATFNRGAAPTDPAYVMYTSGSTGQPKGVIVPQRAIVRLVRAQNYMEFTANEVFLLISALPFDASTWEVWGPLLNGARIGVVRGARLSTQEILQGVRDYNVTSIFLTSALFHMIVDVAPDALSGLRQVLVGGDVMSPEHSFRLMERFPRCQLINVYGPTEATTYSICYRLRHGGWGGGPVPIGVPIAHMRAYILDEDGSALPDGEVGHLWVAGDGVALGYLKRPELTAERFHPDPFAGDGTSMYFTGDLARRRPDGLYEFLGRKDRQVKIEGKRIELDEIEHALRSDPEVSDAVVALRQIGPDDKRIVAFLKPACVPPEPSYTAEVTRKLRQRLAEYMLPKEMHVIDVFPFTPNGKVDRAQLLKMKGA